MIFLFLKANQSIIHDHLNPIAPIDDDDALTHRNIARNVRCWIQHSTLRTQFRMFSATLVYID